MSHIDILQNILAVEEALKNQVDKMVQPVGEWVSTNFPQLCLGLRRKEVLLEAGMETTYPSKGLAATQKLKQSLPLMRV